MRASPLTANLSEPPALTPPWHPPHPPAAGAPLAFVNKRFTTTTGYTNEDVAGKNCKFLQGEATDPDTIELLADAVGNAKPVHVRILNYRKDGTPFNNLLTLKPVWEPAPSKNEKGEQQWRMAFFVGVQFEADPVDSRGAPGVLELEALIRTLPNEVGDLAKV